jgi:hypothetical protein
MTYKNQLSPWCIIRPLPDLQPQIVGRFRRRVDAESRLQILRRTIPNISYSILFNTTPEDTDSSATPNPTSELE